MARDADKPAAPLIKAIGVSLVQGSPYHLGSLR